MKSHTSFWATAPKRITAALLVAIGFSFQAQAETAPLGDDGLHKPAWFETTFKDVREDIESAAEQGKRLALIFEQSGCIYCRKMHEQVLSDPKVAEYISTNFMVVQYNLYGDEEVTDLDGKVLSEKEIARRWGLLFTPTVVFMPEEAPAEAENLTAHQAAVAVMPGAFGKGTTLDMYVWIREKGYLGKEDFQRYHSRKIQERKNATIQ